MSGEALRTAPAGGKGGARAPAKGMRVLGGRHEKLLIQVFHFFADREVERQVPECAGEWEKGDRRG